MEAAHRAMKAVSSTKKVTLHVRVSNRAALNLYSNSLKYEYFNLTYFRNLETTVGYYADGEDAYLMRKILTDKYDLGLDAEDTIEIVKDGAEVTV